MSVTSKTSRTNDSSGGRGEVASWSSQSRSCTSRSGTTPPRDVVFVRAPCSPGPCAEMGRNEGRAASRLVLERERSPPGVRPSLSAIWDKCNWP